MGRARKGSKLHMQDAVSHRQEALAVAVGDALPALRGRRLSWVSPLAMADFAEFYDGPFLSALGLDVHRGALREFWPSRGPNWDALATVDGPSGGVVLVEAKAHVRETPDRDRCTASSETSLALIESSLLRTRAYLRVPDGAPRWTERHYQTANRLAHLWWLHSERGVPTWLVFLGFTGSRAWPDPLTAESWRVQMASTLANLGVPLDHPLADRVGVASMPA